MTDDPAMLRLLAATEAAGSKLVIMGDHRQLGAVGPGGSLEALVSRHSGGVHVLTENVRQADPEERAVLAQLRAGNVEQAVNWYAEHDRINPPGRDEALDQMVAAWAKDVAEGKETAMLAWRRANVAALNSRARAAMAEGRPAVRAGAARGRQRLPGRRPDRHPRPLGARPAGHLPARQGYGRRPRAGTLTVSMDDGSTHTLGPNRSAPTVSPSATPRRSTAAKGPPSTPPTSSLTVAAESSGTWA